MSFTLSGDTRAFFEENGFAIIPGFLSGNEIQKIKEATGRLVSQCLEDDSVSVFSATKHDQARDVYFAESGDKIRGFLEETAVDPVTSQLLIPKEKSFNKIAHALHQLDPVFHEITFSDKVKNVLSQVTSIKKPTVVQSMVIFKNPQVGAAVKPHQDGSYLYTEPMERSVIGFWIALDEANSENGCLYFLPRSHKDNPLQERFIRNPDPNPKEFFIYRGSRIDPIPSDKLVGAPCKAGDLVLIDGLVIHQSAHNTSNHPRLAYTFHIYDANSTWSQENWLQPTKQGSFMEIQLQE